MVAVAALVQSSGVLRLLWDFTSTVVEDKKSAFGSW